MSGSPFESTTILYRVLRRASAAGTSGNGRSRSMCATRCRTSSIVWGMPARSSTQSTDRWPISRYDVCSRCSRVSIIEFSKCVRRHQVTNAWGSPVQPFARRYGAATSVRPVCMSTTVPYWSNIQTWTRSRSSATVAGGTALSRHDPTVLRHEALPRRKRCVLGGVDQGRRIGVNEAPVVDDDAAVHQHGRHVLRVPVIDEVLDRVEGRREAERPVVEDHQVRALAGLDGPDLPLESERSR